MKTWQSIVLGMLFGCALIAGIFIAVQQPRGIPITLQPAPTPNPMLVHITGCVVNPGLYELPLKSRLQDAINIAGGLTDCANLGYINLAALISDGQKIYVPSTSESEIEDNSSPSKSIPGNQSDSVSRYPIDINTASLNELLTLPGIGEVKAKSIINYRDQHGAFLQLEDILLVPGIGEKTLDQIRTYITINN